MSCGIFGAQVEGTQTKSSCYAMQDTFMAAKRSWRQRDPDSDKIYFLSLGPQVSLVAGIFTHLPKIKPPSKALHSKYASKNCNR